jgi:hypothetical protein
LLVEEHHQEDLEVTDIFTLVLAIPFADDNETFFVLGGFTVEHPQLTDRCKSHAGLFEQDANFGFTGVVTVLGEVVGVDVTPTCFVGLG